MLAPGGPCAILGSAPSDDGLAQPIAPAAGSLFGPRGAALATPEGPLIVSDTGHHRLLIWHARPSEDFAAADCVIGQPDFSSEGRNAKGMPGAATLNVPTGVAVKDGVLAVADAWNHRVLIWRDLPQSTNQPADIVLGQSNFSNVEANHGGVRPHADTLNWCYGVAFIGKRFCVADTGNRRVLVWDELPVENGQPADHVLGQTSFTCRDENAGKDAGPLGMRWPHDVVQSDDVIFVADAGNNRIMVWRELPDGPGALCDFVLGQADCRSLEHNRSRYWPDAGTLSMPYGLAVCRDWLVSADTANSRLIGWKLDAIRQGAEATGLAGQNDFTKKGDNRWQLPQHDSLCWPYGLSAIDGTLVIADSGNNRVLLWELAE